MLHNGTLYLDPAPTYCPAQPKLNKRRSQWRVIDIAEAAQDLYSEVRRVSLIEAMAASDGRYPVEVTQEGLRH